MNPGKHVVHPAERQGNRPETGQGGNRLAATRVQSFRRNDRPKGPDDAQDFCYDAGDDRCRRSLPTIAAMPLTACATIKSAGQDLTSASDAVNDESHDRT